MEAHSFPGPPCDTHTRRLEIIHKDTCDHLDLNLYLLPHCGPDRSTESCGIAFACTSELGLESVTVDRLDNLNYKISVHKNLKPEAALRMQHVAILLRARAMNFEIRRSPH
jgi:hypothetical protein